MQTSTRPPAQRNTLVATATAAARRVPNVALTAGTKSSGMGRAVSSLLERDLVLKLDGRARSVRLTREGEALIEGINQVSAERERRLLAEFSDEEAAVLLGFLGRLMLNVPALTELAESRVFEALRD